MTARAGAGGSEAAIAESINRALGLAQAGRLRDAIAALSRDRAVGAHPAGRNVIGVLHMQAGDAATALGFFEGAVALAPALADAQANRGVALQQLGRLDEALSAYDAALRAAPKHLNAAFSRANVLKLMHRPEDALKAFDRVVKTKPDLAEGYLNRAYVQAELRGHGAALADFEAALRLEPGRSEAAIGRVSALTDLRRFDEALAGIDRLLAAQPANADATVIRCQILIELDREGEALAIAERLIAEKLAGSKAHIARAAALWRLGRRDEAIAAASDAVRRFPDDAQAHQALSQYCLGVGDYARGWAEYDYRGDSFDARQAEIERAAPRWNGEPLHGRTILVTAEQGIGDTIQFSRLLLGLYTRGATVKALVQPALLRLAGSLPAPVQWFDRVSAVGPFDFQIPMMSLPRIFGMSLDAVPAEVPYLAPDPGRVAEWAERLAAGSGYRVGIIWQGNPNYRNDRRRSVPLRFHAALAAVPGVRLISLQAVHGLDQLKALPDRMTVETLGDKVTANPDGVSEVAAVMANLDLVVSSDTAMAHLAGALGRPVWVALSDDPDWRWLLDRADSPWYPTMRLFRQATRGDWASVFAAMASALRAETGRA